MGWQLGCFLGEFCVCVGVFACLVRVVFFKFSLILEDETKKHLLVAFCRCIPPAVWRATRSRAGGCCCLKTSFL